MPTNKIYQTVWNEDGDQYVLARVYILNTTTYNMVAAVAADVTSVSRSVYEVDQQGGGNGTLVHGATSLTVDSSLILAALSTGDIWTRAGGDSTGFNFINLVPAAAFPTGERYYQVEYLFTFTGSIQVPLLIRGPVISRFAG
jgi:hypothetical protein